jgi:uncharacterized protein YkwD
LLLTPVTAAGLVLAAQAAVGAPDDSLVAQSTATQGVASYASQVVTLTNAQRTAHGCKALTVNSILTSVAYAHSKDMAVRNYFSHNTPEGVSPFTRMTKAGYSWQMAAENIAAGYPTPKAVVDGWMNSPGHRANILNCKLKEIGVGYYAGGSYRYYWTEDFGTPWKS